MKSLCLLWKGGSCPYFLFSDECLGVTASGVAYPLENARLTSDYPLFVQANPQDRVDLLFRQIVFVVRGVEIPDLLSDVDVRKKLRLNDRSRPLHVERLLEGVRRSPSVETGRDLVDAAILHGAYPAPVLAVKAIFVKVLWGYIVKVADEYDVGIENKDIYSDRKSVV